MLVAVAPSLVARRPSPVARRPLPGCSRQDRAKAWSLVRSPRVDDDIQSVDVPIVSTVNRVTPDVSAVFVTESSSGSASCRLALLERAVVHIATIAAGVLKKYGGTTFATSHQDHRVAFGHSRRVIETQVAEEVRTHVGATGARTMWANARH